VNNTESPEDDCAGGKSVVEYSKNIANIKMLIKASHLHILNHRHIKKFYINICVMVVGYFGKVPGDIGRYLFYFCRIPPILVPIGIFF